MNTPAQTTVWLRIKLVTEVVVTRRTATVGVHECLDYLPGSVLLGAAAARLFATIGFGAEFFLSGKVRFGDGLPDDGNGGPAWPVPLNYHVAKGAKAEDAPLINPLVAEPPKDQQRAQVRDRHLMAGGRRDGLKKLYQLKTAITRDEFGRADENQLFGYEALPAGLVFLAPITFRADVNEATRKKAIELLTGGGIRLGRSRSAQYGEVEIAELAGGSVPGWPGAATTGSLSGNVVLYLASDLALVNECGAPTLVPEPAHFELPEGSKYLGDESFLRSRRYSPWNAFRGARDAERQVLVRGSVLIFSVRPGFDRAALSERLQSDGVGLHTAEGLGRVLVDPQFVFSPPGFRPVTRDHKDSPRNHSTGNALPVPDHPLAHCLCRRAEERRLAADAERLGEEWMKACFDWRKRHPFPPRSQWNQIRELTVREEGWFNGLKEFFGLAEGTKPPDRARIWNTPPDDCLGNLLLDKAWGLQKGELARAALRETAMRVVRAKPEGI